MAEPKQFRYSDVSGDSPRVYLVDDAWFEGNDQAPRVIDTCGLGGLHRQDRPLTALVTRLRDVGASITHGDVSYLHTIAELCLSRGFELVLSNFEAMKEKWDDMNQEGVAIAVDLNYHRVSEPLYGLSLLHESLKGCEPRAVVFIVTGGPSSLATKLADPGLDWTWWPLRALRVVDKNESSMRPLLEAFAENFFRRRNDELPVISFLRLLLMARRQLWSHPNSFDEVPDFVPLRHMYEDDCENFKALFDCKSLLEDRPRYPITMSAISTLLSTSGFPVSGPSERVVVKLPLAPAGMLWIAQVWLVLHRLKECRASDSDAAHIALDEVGIVTIRVPLNGNLISELNAALSDKSCKGRACWAIEAVRERALANELLSLFGERDRDGLIELQAAVTYLDATYQVVINDAMLIVRWRGVFA